MDSRMDWSPGAGTRSEGRAPAGLIETDIPARLDRLRWSRFHTLVAVALGITWVLDGLEVTLSGSVSGALKASLALHMSDPQIGLAASAYLLGAVSGAFLFGWLTDRLGRRRLFFVTLGLYLAASAAMVLSPSFEWYLPPLRPARLVSPSGRPSRWRCVRSRSRCSTRSALASAALPGLRRSAC